MASAVSGGHDLNSGTVARAAFSIVSSRLADNKHMTREYQTVLQLDEDIAHSSAHSLDRANVPRNRYSNILCFDWNRVLLPGQGARDYINASHVTFLDRITAQEFRYIATQGPIPSTAIDFWRMVLHQQCPMVIMLTCVVEKGVSKCTKYYPDSPGDVLELGQGLQVTCTGVDSSVHGQLMMRSLMVQQQSTSLTATVSTLAVQHYQYNAWPDHGAPKDSTAIRQLCSTLDSLRQQRRACSHTDSHTGPARDDSAVAGSKRSHASAGPSSPSSAASEDTRHVVARGITISGSGTTSPSTAPVLHPDAVVHCSAGIGRTGTFCAIDIIRKRLHVLTRKAGRGELPAHAVGRLLQEALDLPTLVHELRQQRMGMVQTFEQYCWVYKAIRDELHVLATSSTDS